ncbi:MAG: hypothetical protein ACK55Z_03230 [bacterium]
MFSINSTLLQHHTIHLNITQHAACTHTHLITYTSILHSMLHAHTTQQAPANTLHHVHFAAIKNKSKPS